MSGNRQGGPPKGPMALKDLLEREGIKDYFGATQSTCALNTWINGRIS
jgi:hypothetical protein